MSTNTESQKAEATEPDGQPPLIAIAGLLSIKAELAKRIESVEAEIKAAIARSPVTMTMLRELVSAVDAGASTSVAKPRRPRKPRSDRGKSRVRETNEAPPGTTAPAEAAVEEVAA